MKELKKKSFDPCSLLLLSQKKIIEKNKPFENNFKKRDNLIFY